MQEERPLIARVLAGAFVLAALFLFLKHARSLGTRENDIDALSRILKPASSILGPGSHIGFATDQRSEARANEFYFKSQFVLVPAVLSQRPALFDTVLVLDGSDWLRAQRGLLDTLWASPGPTPEALLVRIHRGR